MGKACLCSDLVEIRQLGGNAVVYFQPHDVAAIERELRALAGDPASRSRLGAQARTAVRRFADPRAAAQRFVGAVEDLLSRRR